MGFNSGFKGLMSPVKREGGPSRTSHAIHRVAKETSSGMYGAIFHSHISLTQRLYPRVHRNSVMISGKKNNIFTLIL